MTGAGGLYVGRARPSDRQPLGRPARPRLQPGLGRRGLRRRGAGSGAVSAGTSDTRRGGVPGAPDGVSVAVPGSPASLDTGSDHLTESRRDGRGGRDSGEYDVTRSGVAAAGTSAASHGGRPVGLGGTLPPASCGPLVLTVVRPSSPTPSGWAAGLLGAIPVEPPDSPCTS